MKEIQLTNSIKSFIIDDENYNEIIKHRWYLLVTRKKPNAIYTNIKGKVVYLHRFIMNSPEYNGFNVDHKDRNIFNNQKENLRFATDSQNHANSKIYSSNTSGYKNITWNKLKNKWQVGFTKNKRYIQIGRFNSIEEAIKIRDIEVIKIHGEFANIKGL